MAQHENVLREGYSRSLVSRATSLRLEKVELLDSTEG